MCFAVYRRALSELHIAKSTTNPCDSTGKIGLVRHYERARIAFAEL